MRMSRRPNRSIAAAIRPLDGGLIANIGKDRQDFGAEAGDLASNALDRVTTTPTVDHHRCTRRGECQHNGSTDIVARAGDEGNAALQFGSVPTLMACYPNFCPFVRCHRPPVRVPVCG
jgi:hypothetical protein